MEDLVLFYPHGHSAHFAAGHPERPERVEAIRDALDSQGWWESFPKATPVTFTVDFLSGIHDRGYLNYLERAARNSEWLDPDTYTTPASWNLALQSAGGAVALAEQVWTGQARRGLALTRPPGHHASAGRGAGFCLLNNIAVAAEHLLKTCQARRLAIVDLDLHHGNGTQDIFWERGDVFYVSVHQSPLYPNTGFLEERGSGPGLGATANLPLWPGAGDEAYLCVMQEFILPLVQRFSPEMLLVSFGFDAHWLDPLGSLRLSAGGLGEVVEKLVQWADVNCRGRIVFVLEGGYNLEAAAGCCLAVTARLLGLPWQDPIGPCPRQESDSWKKYLVQAKKIWNI